MEEGKPFAYGYYLPMREAVVQLCAAKGQGREAIFQQMVARARTAGGVRASRIAQDNADAFVMFETVFFPKIDKFRRDLLRNQRTGCEFEGLTLEGGPHLEVTDHKGNKRHIFLHAANWSANDLAAYLELLGIVIEANYGGDSSSLWVFDLKRGREIAWRPSARVRRRCSGAAKLYGRFVRTMEHPEEG